MSESGSDPFLVQLSRLPAADPDAAFTERVRIRAHSQLTARRIRTEARAVRSGVARRLVDGLLYGACALYALGAAIEAMKLSAMAR